MLHTLIHENKRNITCLAGCVLTVLALRLNMDIQEGESGLILFLESFKSIEIFDLILMPLLYGFYRYVWKNCGGQGGLFRPACTVPAVFFSFCMVMGYSFYRENSWVLVLGSKFQCLKSLIAFLGYFFLFFFSIVWLFDRAEGLDTGFRKKDKASGIVSRYFEYFRRHPFGTCFLTLLIVYIPYMILSYPGILSTDSRRQIIEGCQYLYVDGSRLKNHHPVVHTMLLSSLISAGKNIFGSANAGLFLYSCIQAGLVLASISWLLCLLAELELSNGCLAAAMLFFVLSPRTQNYMFLAAKDACFAPFLMLYIVQLYRLSADRYGQNGHRMRHVVLFLISVLGVFFMRQDGFYLLLLTFAAAAVLNRRNRRRWLALGAGTLVFFMIYQLAVLPGLGIAPSSRREMLSIPFQQTARYVKEAENEITDEEKETISVILDYENLGELYNPNLSDPVKGTFNDEASGEELAAYFKVWFEMLLKRPDIYVQATMNNLYGYFYPNGYTANLYDYEKSAEQMEKVNGTLAAEWGISLSYPTVWEGIRNGYEAFRESVFKIPVLSALLSPAFYVWLLLLWFFLCTKNRDKTALLLVMPLMVLLLICMAGPAYGWYFRYLYSLAFCLPAVIFPGLYHIKATEQKVCS